MSLASQKTDHLVRTGYRIQHKIYYKMIQTVSLVRLGKTKLHLCSSFSFSVIFSTVYCTRFTYTLAALSYGCLQLLVVCLLCQIEINE